MKKSNKKCRKKSSQKDIFRAIDIRAVFILVVDESQKLLDAIPQMLGMERLEKKCSSETAYKRRIDRRQKSQRKIGLSWTHPSTRIIATSPCNGVMKDRNWKYCKNAAEGTPEEDRIKYQAVIDDYQNLLNDVLTILKAIRLSAI